MPLDRATLEQSRRLRQAGLDANALGPIAELHTICQAIGADAGPAGEIARRCAVALERVMLREAPDPGLCLAQVILGMEAIERIAEGGVADVAEVMEALPGAEAPAPMAKADDAEHLRGFVEESREHLESMEAALLDLERDPRDARAVRALFRAVHTIKGIAGFLNLGDIRRLSHEVETLLELARAGTLEIHERTVDLLFQAIDLLRRQIVLVAEGLERPAESPGTQPDISGVISRLRAAPRGEVPDPDPTRQNGPSCADRPSAESASIRIDTRKLDALVDGVGELVIAQSILQTHAAVRADDDLARTVSQVSKIVREIQETSMCMRMAPIGPIFQRMRRLSRDMARKADKQVELVISGEQTEMDKHVIQAISDPLVHLVRNAIDHGLEPPGERSRQGKPACGRVELRARHDRGHVVVEVRDDGRGLDVERLMEKARQRGLLAEGQSLSEKQACQLVFAPGLSTAASVTEFSGRGVGMDVVKRNIDALRGKIEIHSETGRGSAFRIRLPLTLAIIDGMLVRAGAHRAVIPTLLIERSFRPRRGQVRAVSGLGPTLFIDGQPLPLVQLGPLFEYGPPVDPTEGIVVVTHAEHMRFGVVVDELIGQQQIVVKSLGARFQRVRGVSGAAILGDGRVGLIIEPAGLLELHRESVSQAAGAAVA